MRECDCHGFETFALLYPQLDDVDFGTDVRRLDMPTYMSWATRS